MTLWRGRYRTFFEKPSRLGMTCLGSGAKGWLWICRGDGGDDAGRNRLGLAQNAGLTLRQCYARLAPKLAAHAREGAPDALSFEAIHHLGRGLSRPDGSRRSRCSACQAALRSASSQAAWRASRSSCVAGAHRAKTDLSRDRIAVTPICHPAKTRVLG